MSYEYDVFFSYKRHGLTLDWTRQVRKCFEHWLGEEFADRTPKVFVDENCIEAGDVWPEKLKIALRHSRCMVSILSTTYFQSSWCISEWKTFTERQTLTKRVSPGLIASLKFHDGEYFPPEAKKIEWIDVSQYAYTLPAFWLSANAVELEKLIKQFAVSVARMVKAAPDFNADWPIVAEPGQAVPVIELAKL